MPPVLYRFHDLAERGIVTNRTTLARWIKSGQFPAPVSLGPNIRAWPADEIEQWLDERAAQRGEAA